MRYFILFACLLVVAASLALPARSDLGGWNPDMGPFGAVHDSIDGTEDQHTRVKRQWGRRGYYGGRGGGGWGRGGGGWGRGYGGRGGWGGGRRYGGWGWG